MKKKLLVLIIGIIFSLLLLEISLHITGYFIGKLPIEDNSNLNGSIILALGNSHTAGFGAPAGKSYPSQLQYIIDKNNMDSRVINLGVASMNSYKILERLEGNILRYEPQIIILQTGSPNLWDNYGYENYLERENITDTDLEHKDSIINNFATYSFFSNIFDFKTKENKSLIKSNTSSNLSYAINTNLESYNIIYYELQKDIQNLSRSNLSYYKNYSLQRINQGHHDITDYIALTIIYYHLDDYENSARYYEDAINFNEPPNNGFAFRYYHLLESYLSNPSIIKDKIEGYIIPSPDDNYSKKNDMINWAISDINEISRISRENNIKLVILNYPPRFDRNQEEVEILNQRIIDYAVKNNIDYFDINQHFKEIWKVENRSIYLEEILGKEGNHLNAKGYNVVSKELFKMINDY